MDKTTLRRIQLTQLEILKYIDAFCRKNKIRYSLYGGTLLGAVRHQGFIPWDDDLDICMPREDYEQFIVLWENDKCNKFILQNKDNTPGFNQSFTKIRKKHTMFLQDVDQPKLYHTGIFVDVFPVDRMPAEGVGRYLFQLECIVYQICTKEYVLKSSNKLVENLSKVFLLATSERTRFYLRNKLIARIKNNNNHNNYSIVAIENMKAIRTPFPPDLMDEYIEIEFEDDVFMCIKQYDLWLNKIYGDYMKLPPEEERVGLHNLIAVDFEHDYDECIKMKKIEIQ